MSSASTASTAATAAILARLVDLVRDAAQVVMKHYDGMLQVDLKGPNDPVTAADREADELLCSKLRELYPDAAVVGEESAPTTERGLEELSRSRRVFYVDPLDGTKEFIAHNGEFSVLIGLCVDGRPTLGVIALPAEGRVLAGEVGGEVYAVDARGHREPLGLSRTARLAEVTMLVSRSHTPPLVERVRQHAGLHQMLPCGSVGVKVARLLDGQADAYLHDGGGLKRWDCCGPEAVLRAAGGAVTDLGGEPLRYRTDALAMAGGLAASNGAVHEPLLASVAAVRQDVANGEPPAV